MPKNKYIYIYIYIYIASTFININHTVIQIWNYLHPIPYTLFHTRAVELIWDLSKTSPSGVYLVEDVMASMVNARNITERMEHFQKFGVFWRLSEYKDQTSFLFSRPLFALFDCLKSQYPTLKRSGETWFKTFVHSYTR